MTEVNTPVANTAPPVPSKKSAPKKATKKHIVVLCAVIAVILGGYFLYHFLTAQETGDSAIQVSIADYSSIVSSVQGNGNAKAKESAAITLTAGGTVQEVLVTAGDIVMAGQPLYTIRSEAALEEVTLAQETVENLQADMSDLVSQAQNLTTRAPFNGKLIDVGSFTADDTASTGAEVATIVNDRTLKLSLYFSYAYENQISVGQAVSIAIPAVMADFTGTVEKIHKVSFISPEGATYFEVVVNFANPGTLTEGMGASATLYTADGTPIYPYENTTTEYYETRTLTVDTAGPVLSSDLLRYANVTAGQALLTLGSDDIDSQIRAKQQELDDAYEALDVATKALGNFNAVAPIDGTVTSCSLMEGQEVKGGDTVIIISNNTTMLVNITVDDRNISYVKPGMTVDLTDWNGNMFMGVVSSIDMGNSEMGQGMTSYPVTLTVDNFGGSLMEGVWLDYSFITSQSDNCIVVPMQSVQYVSDEEGNTFSVVFVKADSRPDSAVDIEIPETSPGQLPKYPSPADGYYPVKVATGLSDNYNVEITEGLSGGEEIFTSYYVEYGSSWG